MLKTIHDLRILGLKKFWGNFLSTKINVWSKKNFVHQNFGPNKFWLKKFGQKKTYGVKEALLMLGQLQ